MYTLRVLFLLLYMTPAAAVVWTCKDGDKVVFRSEPCEAPEATLDRVEWHSPWVRVPRSAYGPSQPPAADSKPLRGIPCSVNHQCGTRERCQVEGGAARGVCVPK